MVSDTPKMPSYFGGGGGTVVLSSDWKINYLTNTNQILMFNQLPDDTCGTLRNDIVL